MSSLVYTVVYSVGLFVLTFAATSLPLMFRLSKSTSKTISSIGVGLMLGTAFIVIIPEALARGCECPLDKLNKAAATTVDAHIEVKNLGMAIVVGFVFMMVGESFVHGHSECHDEDDSTSNNESSEPLKGEVVIDMSDINIKKLRTTIYGICLHSLFDGLAVGSSVIAVNTTAVQTIFISILLHKISSSVGIGIYIKQLHLSLDKACRYIALFSAATPISTVLSAVLLYFGSSFVSANLLAYAFAVSAGTFLHVSVTHILPSVGHHVGFVQVSFILIGAIIPYLLFVEHSH